MNDGFNINLLKIMKKDMKGVLLFDLSKTNVFNNISKKRTIPVARGYFPEDFSLNIYKSTSLYKKRYQIEPMRLKRQLKKIKIQKASMKNDNIIKTINKKMKEDCFSSDQLRLLKSNKIDRFAKRYLENKNKTSKTNITNNMKKDIKKKFIITLSPKNHNKEIKYTDEDKINNEDIISKNLLNSLEYMKGTENTNGNPNFDNNSFIYHKLEGNSKNNMINSGVQTPNINQNKENIKEKEHSSMKGALSQRFLKNNYIYDSLSSYNNEVKSPNNENISHLITKKHKLRKKYLFWDRKNEKIKLLSPKNSSLIKNIINKFDKNKKLIYSFYNPNDIHIKLLKEYENKLKEMNKNNKDTNFRTNIFYT